MAFVCAPRYFRNIARHSPSVRSREENGLPPLATLGRVSRTVNAQRKATVEGGQGGPLKSVSAALGAMDTFTEAFP
jgi:hypothetical protein